MLNPKSQQTQEYSAMVSCLLFLLAKHHAFITSCRKKINQAEYLEQQTCSDLKLLLESSVVSVVSFGSAQMALATSQNFIHLFISRLDKNANEMSSVLLTAASCVCSAMYLQIFSCSKSFSEVAL